ncbi:MAG: alginate export family protein [Candidatus Brocadiia bacterium]
MKKGFLFTFTVLSVLAISGLAYAAVTPDKVSPLVRIKDKYYTFIEDPLLYENGNVVLKMGLDLRVRMENFSQGDNGMFGGTESNDTYITYRAMGSLNLEAGETFTFFLEGIWAGVGSYYISPAPSDVADALDLHRLTVSIHPPDWPFVFTIGRQYFKVEDGRFLGYADWSQVPVTFDGVGAKYKGGEAWSLNMLVGMQVWPDNHNFDTPSNDENPGVDDDFVYAALWGDYRFSDELNLGVFLIAKVDDNNQTQGEDGQFSDWRTYTYGVRGYGKVYGMDYSIDVALQQGNHGSDDIGAWSTEMRVGYSFESNMNPRLEGAFTFAAGDNEPLDGKYATFDPLVNDGIDRYGLMGVVSASNATIIYIGGQLEPIERLTLSLKLFQYSRVKANDEWYDPKGPIYAGWFDSKNLGTEIDLGVSYGIDKYTTVSGGFATLFGSQFLEDKGLKDGGTFLYVSLRLKF